MNIPIRQYWQLLSSYLAPQRRRVLVLFALVAAATALQVAGPQIIRIFIDNALAGRSEAHLVVLAGLFVLLALAAQALAVLNTYLSETVGWTATNALRYDLAAHLLGLDMSFHKTRTPGEMIQRIDGDIDALSMFFSQFVLSVLGNVMLMAGVLFLLFLEDWRVGLAFTLFAMSALAALVRLRAFAVPRWVVLREEMSQFYGFVGEQLAGREDVSGNGARAHSMRLFYDHMRHWRGLTVRSSMTSAWMWMASVAVFTFGNVIAIVLSFYLWERGALTVGGAYLIFNYTEMLRRPIDQIREQVQQLQSAGASITRVKGLLEIESHIADTGRTALPAGPLAVLIRDVSFGYEPGDPVLRDVSLALAPGEVLGLLGRTGSGKTTLGRLLVRLYDIDSGGIEIGGVPIRDVPLAGLRDRVGVVSQDVQLLDGTVRDNLTLFDRSVPDARLLEVIGLLGLDPWFQSYPNGLDAHIAGAGGLSAGEAQLLACARLFLKDPGLVVLDEATSRLDPATQRIVDGAVARLLRGRTAIIVAHRLATVDRADKIAILEGGRIVEAGSRVALLADRSSRFARLRELDAEALIA